MLEPAFGFSSLLFLAALGVTLLVLPLVLPPLPPPPMALMFVPVLIMSLLLMLAFHPAYIPEVITAAYDENQRSGLLLNGQKGGQEAGKQYHLRQPFTSWGQQVPMYAQIQRPEFYFRI